MKYPPENHSVKRSICEQIFGTSNCRSGSECSQLQPTLLSQLRHVFQPDAESPLQSQMASLQKGRGAKEQHNKGKRRARQSGCCAPSGHCHVMTFLKRRCQGVNHSQSKHTCTSSQCISHIEKETSSTVLQLARGCCFVREQIRRTEKNTTAVAGRNAEKRAKKALLCEQLI